MPKVNAKWAGSKALNTVSWHSQLKQWLADCTRKFNCKINCGRIQKAMASNWSKAHSHSPAKVKELALHMGGRTKVHGRESNQQSGGLGK